MTTETDKPQRNGSMEIEWNWDLDENSLKINSLMSGDEECTIGKEGRFELRGRCRRCWGGLIGKKDARQEPIGIRCRVCGLLLEGDEAKEEYDRMSKEAHLNASSILLSMRTNYHDDARFVMKLFPYMDRLPAEEIRQRVSNEAKKGFKRHWLTRRSFPAGSAGYLFLQAEVLMSGVERFPRHLSVMRSPKEQLGEHSKTREKETMKRLGSTMTIALMSAFACELAMKAICLTLRDEVRKSHDLWKLYSNLPEDSKTRIEEDFPEVCSAIKDVRHTFGKWRYFEMDVGALGIKAMIDTERAFSLGKAARVLLDEALLMGLGFSFDINMTKQDAETVDWRQTHVIDYTLGIRPRECPPR